MNRNDYYGGLPDRETVLVIMMMSVMGAVGIVLLGCGLMEVTFSQIGLGTGVGLLSGVAGLLFSGLLLINVLRNVKH